MEAWPLVLSRRDRPDPDGHTRPDPFDPSAVDLMRSLLARAKQPGHLYPLAMYSWPMMPPPKELEKVGLGSVAGFKGCTVHRVGLMRSLLARAKQPGHLYPLAMYSWPMMPPPKELEKVGLGSVAGFKGCTVHRVGLMRSLLARAKQPGHLYPLAMYSWPMMPPPKELEKVRLGWEQGSRGVQSSVGDAPSSRATNTCWPCTAGP